MIFRRSLSPLRYPGGKGFLARYVGKWLIAQDISISKMFEVYAGGAGLSIGLLMGGVAKEIHLNDKFYPVWAFWLTLSSDPDFLIDKVRNTEVSVENFTRCRNTILNPQDFDQHEVAAAFLYFSRTSHAGALTGGPIGGYKQSGTWKIDARFNREELAKRLIEISMLGRRIFSYNSEGMDFLRANMNESDDTVVFLDPPYYKKGRRLYKDWMTQEKYLELRDFLTECSDKFWILTIDDCQETREIFGGFHGSKLQVRYTVSGNRADSELIFFSERCHEYGIGEFLPGKLGPDAGSRPVENR